ncbi:MAG TPA: phosphoesterase [archaeon]|nr:phosphoesterase [archaeon]
MEISKGIEIIDLALWIRDERVLAIADLGIGAEKAAGSGFVPRLNYTEITSRLEEKIFRNLEESPELIIINGAIKRESGASSTQENQEAAAIIEFLKRKCPRIVLVKGSNDAVLKSVADKQNILFEDYHLLDSDVLFIHGDKEPEEALVKKAKTIIIGQQNPSMSAKDGDKEGCKCFMRGKYKKKELIVMPSMNSVTTGNDLLGGEVLSPLIKEIGKFEVFAVKDKIQYLGEIGDL